MPRQGPCARRSTRLNSEAQHHHWWRRRAHGSKEKVFYFSTFSVTFFLLFEQGVPHFQLPLGSAKYIAGPGDRDG